MSGGWEGGSYSDVKSGEPPKPEADFPATTLRGKDTVFYVFKQGKVHRKFKSDIGKHFHNDNKESLLSQDALNRVPRGTTI